jgi:hypothetical protein
MEQGWQAGGMNGGGILHEERERGSDVTATHAV